MITQDAEREMHEVQYLYNEGSLITIRLVALRP